MHHQHGRRERDSGVNSSKDGNGSGSVRVEYLGTQNRNPNLKPEPDPNSYSGTNSNPQPKTADTRNRTDNPTGRAERSLPSRSQFPRAQLQPPNPRRGGGRRRGQAPGSLRRASERPEAAPLVAPCPSWNPVAAASSESSPGGPCRGAG